MSVDLADPTIKQCVHALYYLNMVLYERKQAITMREGEQVGRFFVTKYNEYAVRRAKEHGISRNVRLDGRLKHFPGMSMLEGTDEGAAVEAQIDEIIKRERGEQ